MYIHSMLTCLFSYRASADTMAPAALLNVVLCSCSFSRTHCHRYSLRWCADAGHQFNLSGICCLCVHSNAGHSNTMPQHRKQETQQLRDPCSHSVMAFIRRQPTITWPLACSCPPGAFWVIRGTGSNSRWTVEGIAISVAPLATGIFEPGIGQSVHVSLKLQNSPISPCTTLVYEPESRRCLVGMLPTP